jgi:hypothetical protein
MPTANRSNSLRGRTALAERFDGDQAARPARRWPFAGRSSRMKIRGVPVAGRLCGIRAEVCPSAAPAVLSVQLTAPERPAPRLPLKGSHGTARAACTEPLQTGA